MEMLFDCICGEKAELICHCSQPPTYLCVGCLSEHYKTNPKQIHTQTPIPEVDNNLNSVCEHCHSEPEYICICRNRRSFLCRNCRVLHIDRFPTGAHSFESLANLDLFHSEEAILRFTLRKKTVGKIKKHIEQNSTEIQNFTARMEAIRKTVHESIEKVFEKTLNTCLEAEKEMERWNTEFEEAAYSATDNDTIVNRIVRLAEHEILQDFSVLRSVKASIDHCEITEAVERSIRFEYSNIEDLLDFPVYPKSGTKSLYFFNTKTERVFPIEFPINYMFLKRSAYCCLPKGDIFVCGGDNSYEYSNIAFTLDLVATLSELLAPMEQRRSSHACMHVEGYVYSFGGRFGSNKLRSVEKYSIEERRWSTVGMMHLEHESVSLAKNEKKVYIAGGQPYIEIFDTEIETFTVFPIRLPCSMSKVFLMSSENDIFFLAKSQLYKLELEEPSLGTPKTIGGNLHLANPPQTCFFNEKVYFFSHEETTMMLMKWKEHGLWCFEPKSLVISQIAKIS